MSLVERRLIGHIIGDSFGLVCQRVADLLLVRGPSTLATLILSTSQPEVQSMATMTRAQVKLTARMVKEALVILIHHGLVSWSDTTGNAIIYRLWPDRCILRLLMPLAIAEKEGVLLKIFKLGMIKDEGMETETLLKEGWLKEADAEEEQAEDDNTEGEVKRRKLTKSAWRTINYDHLLRHCLHLHLTRQARVHLNEQAALVVQAALLSANMSISDDSSVSSQVGTYQVDQLFPQLKTNVAVTSGRRGQQQQPQSPVQPFLEAAGNTLDWFGPVPGHAQQLWSIDWSKAARRLQLDACLNYVQGRWGQQSARLMRILEEKGPLDDRSISTHALMLATDVRTRLYAMLREGLVHLIEVPRSADHAASRSLHLWSLPPAGTRLRLARRQWLLQVICNLLERSQLERQRHAVLIGKAERTDVAASIDTLLTEAERKQLFTLRRTLWRLQFQIIGLMRDQVTITLLSHPKQLAMQ